MSRDICAQLYNEIVAIRPQWHSTDPELGGIKVVMTGSASDKPLIQPHIYNKQTKKRLEQRFKDVNDPLKLVIVRDMWLTGFDAPACHTMYVDKPMKGHNLMQAIGIANELKQALKTHTDAKGRGEPTHDTAEAFAILLEKLDIIRGMFSKGPNNERFDYSEFETQAYKL